MFAFRRPAGLLAASAAASLAASAALAGEPPRFAWGKAGVGYDEYRAEAYDCALDGLSTDIGDTEPVERLRRATRQLEALDARQGAAGSMDPVAEGIRHAQDTAAIRQAARPEQQVREVKQILFAAIQRCMAARGYTRIALTEAQRTELARFKDGSPERRVALHRLASDPAVLEAQRQPWAE